MLRFSAAAALFLIGCSSPADPTPTERIPEPSQEVPYDAGPQPKAPEPEAAPRDLFMACDGSRPCPSGWTCYSEHTASSWGFYDGGDVFGHCTVIDCYGGAGFDLCASEDGTCACPVMADGTQPACTGTPVDYTKLVCVPAPRWP